MKKILATALIAAVSICSLSARAGVPTPNGLGFNGSAAVEQGPSIKTCTRNSADCADSNGPSLDGLDGREGETLGIRTCTKTTAECSDPNGPSLDGFAAEDQPAK